MYALRGEQMLILSGLALAGALIYLLVVRGKSAAKPAPEKLPKKSLGSLQAAKELVITDAGLDVLPDRLEKKCPQLVKVDLHNNSFQRFPSSICNLSNLATLDLSSNSLARLPDNIGELQQLQDLNLAHNRLTDLPASIGRLTSLRLFNIMGNSLTYLPGSIGDLKQLYRLGLKSNKLKTLPSGFGGLQALVELFATDNELEQLPAEMGQLTSLVKLQLSFNRLQSLPPEMGSLPRLELMRVAVNNLQEVPESFAGLHKLAWFSLAGNPACAKAPPPRADIKALMPHDVPPEEVLGSGASGEVHASTYEGQAVAVKRFVSDISPDGHARDEIAVTCCIDHPNLIKVIGMIAEPPSLVVGRVHGQQMAAKPNLQSLLRCRWAEDCSFQLSYLLRVAHSTASALQYLHSLSICHGDVYAHNILPDADGNAVLCDYGASFFYNKGPVPWEAQEVRAFGLFVNDMLARLDDASSANSSTVQHVHSLLQTCMDEPTQTRPLFQHVVQELKSFQS